MKTYQGKSLTTVRECSFRSLWILFEVCLQEDVEWSACSLPLTLTSWQNRVLTCAPRNISKLSLRHSQGEMKAMLCVWERACVLCVYGKTVLTSELMPSTSEFFFCNFACLNVHRAASLLVLLAFFFSWKSIAKGSIQNKAIYNVKCKSYSACIQCNWLVLEWLLIDKNMFVPSRAVNVFKLILLSLETFLTLKNRSYIGKIFDCD